MSVPTPPPKSTEHEKLASESQLQTPPKKLSVYKTIRNRIVQGLFVALPVLITFAILHYVASILLNSIINPISRFIYTYWSASEGSEKLGLPTEYENIIAPIAAVVIVLAVLFLCGMFFRSRLHRFFDWAFSNVPGVGVIYSSVKNVIDAVHTSQQQTKKFQRTVLVHFPHTGMKVPAFVTSSCIDTNTKETILCVYVPTTPIPTSGYMLLVPEHDVIDLDWTFQETLQAIVSGGITVPKTVTYGPISSNLEP
jgi:uncharacterized membrane protein